MRWKTALLLAACVTLALCASSEKKLAQAREKDPKYQYNLGLFHLNNGNIPEAIKVLNKCIALSPTHHLAWNALGLAHAMMGELGEAVRNYQKCLEIDPRFSEARNNLGTTYQELGFPDKAEAEFKRASLDETYASRELPLLNLARLYYSQDKLDLAFEHVQRALQFKPRFALALNLKGLVLEKRDDLGGAILAYEQAVKAVPEDLTFNYNLAVACFKNGEYVKAKEVFEKISNRVTDMETRDKIAQYLKIIKEKLG
ncbi:MAG: tetratricopeptide repeat protein [Candidatus Aminicenantes bacterium]|nr:tetratricopeptide repeat protein [Candidatus Aminicenantes bacterium]